MSIIAVAEFPDDGFAILEDSHGKFLAFKDKEDLIPVSDPNPREWPNQWKISSVLTQENRVE